MSSVIVPAYARFWERTRFESTLRALQDVFAYAREQAIVNETTAAVVYDPQNAQLSVTFAPVPPQLDQPLALRPNGNADATVPVATMPPPLNFHVGGEFALTQFTTGTGAGTTLHFRSDGTCEGGEAVLVSATGYAAHLVILPTTGRVTVDDGTGAPL